MTDNLLAQAAALHQNGQIAEAERLYRAILTENPTQPDALALLGVLLGARKDLAGAVGMLERAVRLDPATPLFRFYLGNVLSDSGDYVHAAASLREAVARQPDFADAWAALADAALKLQDYPLALKAAMETLRLVPDHLAAWLTKGLALDFMDREEEAVICFERATRLKPDFLPAWDMLGTTYQNLNRLKDAEAAMRKALTLAGGVENGDIRRPEEAYVIQHWNLALYQLLRGDYINGFAHFRARFKNPGRLPRLSFPQPIWRGEDIRGKKILLVGEQGFGDVLMLCRYGPFLRARGARVVLLVHQALERLLRQSDVADEIICDAPQGQGDYDYQTSIFDLPHLLGTTTETVPAAVPYLPLPAPDEATMLPAAAGMKIGVVWSGSTEHGNDRRRSVPLTEMSALFDVPGVKFFSLTRALKTGEADMLAAHAVVELSAVLKDFLATAQIISQLDLLISCDTSVAHLAGGMGKPVWLLLPFAPDWRWMLQREDSPWYPTMRLFRQRRRADWADVVARVREELNLMSRASQGSEKRA